MEIQALEPLEPFEFDLSPAFSVTGVEIDGHLQQATAAPGSARPWLCDTPPWPQGLVRAVTIHYAGKPESKGEKGCSTLRGDADGLWASRLADWLPYWGVMSTANTHFKASLTVPETWTAFFAFPTVGSEGGTGKKAFTCEGNLEGMLGMGVIAGPYCVVAQGTAGGTPYTVWGLPKWPVEAQRIARALPKALSYITTDLRAQTKPSQVAVYETPNDVGWSFAWPNDQLVIAAWGSTSRGEPLEQYLTHEVIHEGGVLDEGLTEALSLDCLSRSDPVVFRQVLAIWRDYVLKWLGKGQASSREGEPLILPTVEQSGLSAYTDPKADVMAVSYYRPMQAWWMLVGYLGRDKVLAAARLIAQNPDLARAVWTNGATVYPQWVDFMASKVTEVAGPHGRALFLFAFEESHPLDLKVDGARAQPEPGEDGRWSLTFTLSNGGAGENIASDLVSVPWVEVGVWCDPAVVASVAADETAGSAGPAAPSGPTAVPGEPGLLAYRIPLTSSTTLATLSVPARPQEVVLDPNHWLLDLDPANDEARVVVADPRRIIRQAVQVGAAVLLLLGAVLVIRRRPKRLKPLLGEQVQLPPRCLPPS